MLARLFTFTALLIMLLSCRAHHYSHATKIQTAASSVDHLEDKITELHLYGLVALNHELKGQSKKAQAARLEMKKIETQILKEGRRNELTRIISKLGLKSPLYADTLKDLAHKLNVEFTPFKLSRAELMKEITQVKITREFQVFETNVEHLSYKLESAARPRNARL